MTRSHRLVAAALLAVLLIAAPVVGASVLTIDATHPLADEQSIQRYESGHAVSGDLPQVMGSITIAHEAATVGLDGLQYVDTTNHYLRIQYNESIDRQLRIYIPAEYWSPYPKDDLAAARSDLTATLRPTPDGRYTAVTVTLTRPTDAVFVISREAATLWALRHEAHAAINNSTGVDIPSLAAQGQWQYIEPAQLGNESTVAIHHGSKKLLVQFDTDPTSARTWVPVRECAGGDAAVCTFQKDGVQHTTIVLAKAADPPRVRYRVGGSPLDRVFGSIRELTTIDDRLSRLLESLTQGLPW